LNDAAALHALILVAISLPPPARRMALAWIPMSKIQS